MNEYPVKFAVDYPERELSRLTSFFRQRNGSSLRQRPQLFSLFRINFQHSQTLETQLTVPAAA